MRDHSQPCAHDESWQDAHGWKCGYIARSGWMCPGGRVVTIDKDNIAEIADVLPIAWCYTHDAVRDHHVETGECRVPRSMLMRLPDE